MSVSQIVTNLRQPRRIDVRLRKWSFAEASWMPTQSQFIYFLLFSLLTYQGHCIGRGGHRLGDSVEEHGQWKQDCHIWNGQWIAWLTGGEYKRSTRNGDRSWRGRQERFMTPGGGPDWNLCRPFGDVNSVRQRIHWFPSDPAWKFFGKIFRICKTVRFGGNQNQKSNKFWLMTSPKDF